MSNAIPPHSPASSSGSSDSERNEHSKHIRQESAQSDPSLRSHYYNMHASQSSELSAASSTAPSPEQRAPRPLDVSNMLNPTPIKTAEASRRRNADAAELDTPQRVSTTPQQPPFTRSLPPSPTDKFEPHKAKDAALYGTFPRNMRQPIAPSSKLGREGLLPMIDSHQPPHSSVSTPTRLSATLPSPATTSAMQSGGFPFPSIAGQHPATQGPPPPHSLATSPSTSPYSRSRALQHLPPGYSQTSPIYGMNPHYDDGHGSQPMSQSPSQQGYNSLARLGDLAIPVDTTGASKLADEKRKRNAGASARFRQRRKEREREMSTRIAELEARLKNAEEERDHYRNLALRYAGTPLPNTINTNLQNGSRHNHSLQLSPRTMARANQPHMMNEGPYTSPAYAHIREDALGSPGVPLSRTMSTEGRRSSRAYSAGQVYLGGVPVGSGAPEGHDRPMDPYITKSRNGSIHHPRPQPIPEHLNGREQLKTEWGTR